MRPLIFLLFGLLGEMLLSSCSTPKMFNNQPDPFDVALGQAMGQQMVMAARRAAE